MLDLIMRLRATAQYGSLRESLRPGHTSGVGGLWGSACALFAAALADDVTSCLLVACSKPEDAESFADDIAIFAPGAALLFPPRQWLTSDDVVIDQDVVARQVDVLRYLHALQRGGPPGDARVIVTSAPALIQPVSGPGELDTGLRTIDVGGELDPDELAEWLVSREFDHVPMVELPGEFSIRGGIIDIFALNSEWPYRAELSFDRVESIRTFEPRLQGVRVMPRATDLETRLVDRRVRFDIEAVLVVEPLQESVRFSSTLDVSRGAFDVTGEA